jgi:glycosyltransferase involved in cell wall biosynthesis
MLSYLFPPVAGAGVFRTIRFVKHLREFGWKPVILSVQPETALYVGRIDSALCGEIPEGTTVERTRVLRPVASLRAYLRGLLAKMSGRKMGTARVQEARSPATDRTDYVPSRMLRVFGRMCDTVFGTPDSEIGWMFPAVSRGLRLIGQFHPSVVYSTGPPHSTHLIALVLHMLTGLPMVVDLRDPWARTVWMRGTGGFPQWLQRRCEGFCVRRAHRVILNTHTLREEFSAVYRSESPSKFVAIPNGYDHGLLDRVKRLQDDPALPKESGSIRLCHPGTVYGRRDLRPLVDALGLLVQAGHQVRFDQIGIVNNKQELS